MKPHFWDWACRRLESKWIHRQLTSCTCKFEICIRCINYCNVISSKTAALFSVLIIYVLFGYFESYCNFGLVSRNCCWWNCFLLEKLQCKSSSGRIFWSFENFCPRSTLAFGWKPGKFFTQIFVAHFLAILIMYINREDAWSEMDSSAFCPCNFSLSGKYLRCQKIQNWNPGRCPS